MVNSMITKTKFCVHRRDVVLHSCNSHHLPLYLYNVILFTSSFLAISLSMFSLMAEATVPQESQLEIIMLFLVFVGAVCGVLTFLTSSVLFFALRRPRIASLLKSSRKLFNWSSTADILMFLFCIWTSLRFEFLLHDMVDWEKFIQYYQETYIRDDLDAIQKGLKCCGFDSYKDWDLNPYYSCNATGYSRCSVPFSCCKREYVDSECVLGVRDRNVEEISQFIYTEGCLNTTKDWYKYTVILLGFLASYQASLKIIVTFYITSFLKQFDGRNYSVKTLTKSKISKQ